MPDDHEITFTHEELAAELLAMQDTIATGPVDSDLVSLAAFAVKKFDETISLEVSEGLIDEDQAIGFEEFRKGIADSIHEAAKARMGNTPQVNLLNQHKDTPRADAKKRAEELARDAERKANADRVLEQIKTKEADHAVSSYMLRHHWYIDPTVEPHKRNGTWLMRKLEEIEDNGSATTVFTAREAKLLAGNALVEKSPDDILKLKRDLESLAKLHERAKFLGAHVEPGLFSGVSKLKELAETGFLKKQLELKEMRRFIDLLETPLEDLSEKIIKALDEGPFAHCPELDVIPFPPTPERGSKGSLKEIPSDDANEENISDDINKAIQASGSSEYIVEEERIAEFVGLKEHLEQKYPGQIKIYRSLKSNWHPLPWYVIEVAQPEDAPLAVLESPIYGNATYYINNGDWQYTIGFKRTEAQEIGAKPIIHAVAEGQTLEMHTNRVKAVIKEGYKG
jgi:hypothetical protein